MPDVVIENPIINSPYKEPTKFCGGRDVATRRLSGCDEDDAAQDSRRE